MSIPGIIINYSKDSIINSIICHKTGKLGKKVVLTEILESYALQRFFYTINQFDNYFWLIS